MTTDPLSRLASLEGVPSAYAAARDGIDVMLRDRGLRRTSPETTAESLLRGAHASAVLEGSGSSLADVRTGAGDEVAGDAVRVSTELLSLVPTLGRTPLQAMARIHALASATQPA
ncbi:MAG TPA: oxidoreductase, partial [Nocardioides sp.]